MSSTPAIITKPCGKRLAEDGGWCLLRDQHAGECVGRPSLDEHQPPDYGPKRKS